MASERGVRLSPAEAAVVVRALEVYLHEAQRLADLRVQIEGACGRAVTIVWSAQYETARALLARLEGDDGE
jgi:hypothetical protein